MQRVMIVLAALAVAATAGPGFAADDKREEDGKYFTANDEPTYNVKEDGAVDWYTYSGFRRYHSECHVCHGPDGLGSSYAPGLVATTKAGTYGQFLQIVTAGRERVSASQTSKMPSFGENKNVFCYIDDIFVYLRARADDAIPRGRPSKRDPKPATAKAYEKECFAD